MSAPGRGSLSAPGRRRFFIRVAAAGAAAAGARGFAQSGPARVDEDHEQAVSLGYRHDTLQIDARKYPQHASSQRCGNCAFFQGKPADPWAGCAMFGRKQIANAGWCVAWAKAPS